MQTKYNSIEYEKKKNPGKFLCMVKEEIIIFMYNVYLSMCKILSLK